MIVDIIVNYEIILAEEEAKEIVCAYLQSKENYSGNAKKFFVSLQDLLYDRGITENELLGELEKK